MKALFLVCGLLALCSASSPFWISTPFLPQPEELIENVRLDPKESLQLIFNGIWEQGGLNDPKKVINCFNTQSANETLTFIGKMLVAIARSDAVVIPKIVLEYEKTISTSCVYCFGNDTELTDLKVAYKVSNYTVPQLYVAIYKYIITHISDLTRYAQTADFDFSQGQYKQVGTIFGQVAQSAINKSEEVSSVNDDPLTDLQNLLDGLFEQANLPDPTTVSTCFDATTAQVTLNFFGDVINDLAADNYLAIIRDYQTYSKTIPQNVTECIKNNAEAKSVFAAYGFTGGNGKAILQKYLSFGIKHHFELLSDCKAINSDISSGDYNAAGKETGTLIQAIMSETDLFTEEQISEGLDDIIEDIFTQFLAGAN